MAITRIYQSGFELNQKEYEIYEGSASALTIISVNPFTGTYCLSPTGGTTNTHGKIFVPPTAQVRGGFYFRQNGVTTSVPTVFALLNVDTAAITLTWNGTTFTLAAGATTLDTYVPASFPNNTWWHFGFDVKLDGAAGWANIYINGVEQLAFSGDTNDGASTLNVLRVGAGVGTAWTAVHAYDDIYIDDTTGEGAAAIPPLKRFYYIVPTGDGNYSQWDGSDGNSVNNYALVDEIPPNELTDYVTTNTSTDRDSYAMGNTALSAGETVIAVIPTAICRNPAGGGTLKLSTRLSGTDVDSAAKDVGVDWTLIFDRQTTKPGGGSWASTDVDNAEVGITQP